MSTRLLRLFPVERRDWGEAYLTEFGPGPGLLRVFVTAWALTLRKGDTVKTVVVTTSVVSLAFGVFALGLYLGMESPLPVFYLGLGLVAQGSYTLWHIARAGRPAWSRHLLLAGEIVALLVGIGAFAIATVNNLDPLAADREYGPMAAAGVITAQAIATLYFQVVERKSPEETR